MLALKSQKSPGNLGVCCVQFHSGVNGLNSVNHECDGVCISDINWYRCCNFNIPFFLVSVLAEKIGVLVCIVCQTPKTTFNRISNTSNFAKYFPLCLQKL